MKLPWDKDKVLNNDSAVKPMENKLDEIFNRDYIPLNSQLKYVVKSYPDHSFYIDVEDFNKSFTFRVNSYEDLWKLNQIHDVYRYNNRNAVVIIPNLFTSQEDRRFATTQPFGLKLVLEFLKGMEKFDYKIFHPHNSEVVEAILDDRVEILNNQYFVQRVMLDIEKSYNYDSNCMKENLMLMSSDAGGFKPLMKLCDKLKWQGETYSASKSRKYEEGESKLTQIVDKDDFNGKDILIIDDLVVGGATFVGLAKLLKSRNCGNLYLAVSHITVNKPNEELFKHFHKVYTTNSKGLNYFCLNNGSERPDNLVVVDLFQNEDN